MTPTEKVQAITLLARNGYQTADHTEDAIVAYSVTLTCSGGKPRREYKPEVLRTLASVQRFIMAQA